MLELMKKVEKLIEGELHEANEKFPLFRSDHEGVAIIEEEHMEAEEEFAALAENMKELKYRVYHDYTRANKKINTKQMYNIALCGACELIQVAAMAKKFDDSAEARNDG